jgi:acyl-CoA dehydrogenase
MISFENSEWIQKQLQYAETVAREQIRPHARYYDEYEHEFPWDFARFIWETGRHHLDSLKPDSKIPGERFVLQVHTNEMLGWGDLGFYLCLPWPALGGTFIRVVGTEPQKALLKKKFDNEKPTWVCMALTEAHCGSDSSAIRTRAVKDGDSWVLNGEKLFVTTAKMSLIESDGILIVWATTDPSGGSKALKPFIVEAGTPGVKITKLENKYGLKASDTAVVLFEDCRIPAENLLGGEKSTGFKGAMTTFDSARPAAAAAGIGVARAALDFVKEQLAGEGIKIRYGVPRSQLTSIERDIIEMEAQLRATWLLLVKCAWLIDQQKPSTLESSMCKAKAGDVVTRITMKCVELMGTQGYSRSLLLEKWMRDAKVIDLFEGTGQINRLVISRRILGFSSKELR